MAARNDRQDHSDTDNKFAGHNGELADDDAQDTDEAELDGAGDPDSTDLDDSAVMEGDADFDDNLDTDDLDGDGDDTDIEVELSPKDQSARSLAVRRAIEERMERRRLIEDVDYLDLDDD